MPHLLDREVYCDVEGVSFPTGGKFAGIGSLLSRAFTLEEIRLCDTGIGDDDVKQIGSLKMCRRLDLSENPIGDDGLAFLSGMPNLLELDLSGTRVTAKGLGALAKLKHLQFLRLAGVEVGHEGVACLAQMPQLRELNLDQAGLTDLDVPELMKMTWLQKLDFVNNPRISEESERALRHALLNTTVDGRSLSDD